MNSGSGFPNSTPSLHGTYICALPCDRFAKLFKNNNTSYNNKKHTFFNDEGLHTCTTECINIYMTSESKPAHPKTDAALPRCTAKEIHLPLISCIGGPNHIKRNKASGPRTPDASTADGGEYKRSCNCYLLHQTKPVNTISSLCFRRW